MSVNFSVEEETAQSYQISITDYNYSAVIRVSDPSISAGSIHTSHSWSHLSASNDKYIQHNVHRELSLGCNKAKMRNNHNYRRISISFGLSACSLERN